MKVLYVDKQQMPLSMLIIIEGEQYRLRWRYNYYYDFFTIDVYKDEEMLIAGEKIVLNKPLFTSTKYLFEKTYFTPLDLSGQIQRITYDNFNTEVLLYVTNLDDDGNIIEDE